MANNLNANIEVSIPFALSPSPDRAKTIHPLRTQPALLNSAMQTPIGYLTGVSRAQRVVNIFDFSAHSANSVRDIFYFPG